MIAIWSLPFWLAFNGMESSHLGSGAAAAAASGGPDTNDLFLVPADLKIDATIAGRSVRLKIDGDTGARRVVNASIAQALSLRGSGMQGAVRFGPTEMIARSRSVATSIGGLAPERLRWHWFERDVATGADGLISPAVMPYATVLFRLRPSDAGDVTQSLPFRGAAAFGFSGGEAHWAVGDQTFAVGAAFDRPETIVSASAGALLARTNGGQFEGEASVRAVRYGIERPVRLMRFSTPVRVASLTITAVYVRLAEAGASGLPQDDERDERPIDDNEIVVNGERSGKQPRLIISIGSNDLAQCATIAYENRASRLTLSCRA